MEIKCTSFDALSSSSAIVKSDYVSTEEVNMRGQLLSLLRGYGYDDKAALDVAVVIEDYIESCKGKTTECFDYSTPDGIKTYCLNRLNEIRLINQLFPVPSSVVTIAAFMGFLSLLAFGSNALNGLDARCFKSFIRQFLPRYNPGLMYSTFRCGIVHAMSFYPGLSTPRPSDMPSSKQYPKLLVTHCKLWQNHDAVSYDGVSIPAIQVAELLDDLIAAVDAMFSDSSVQANCVKFMNWQPAICAEAFDNGDPEDVVLSGLYNPMR